MEGRPLKWPTFYFNLKDILVNNQVKVMFTLGKYKSGQVELFDEGQYNYVTDWGLEALSRYYFAEMSSFAILGKGLPNEDTATLNNPFIYTNVCDISEGAINNISTWDAIHDVLNVVNTRSLIFPALNADETFKSIGWTPELTAGLNSPLFGCKDINVSYTEGEQPYVRISIIRTIDVEARDNVSGSSFNYSGRVDIAYNFIGYTQSDKGYSSINPDGSTKAPTQTSFLEVKEPANDYLRISAELQPILANYTGAEFPFYDEALADHNIVAHYEYPFGDGGLITISNYNGDYMVRAYVLTIPIDVVTTITEIILGTVHSTSTPIILTDSSDNPYLVYPVDGEYYVKHAITLGGMEVIPTAITMPTLNETPDLSEIRKINDHLFIGYTIDTDFMYNENCFYMFDFRDDTFVYKQPYPDLETFLKFMTTYKNHVFMFNDDTKCCRFDIDIIARTVTSVGVSTIPGIGFINPDYAVIREYGDRGVDTSNISVDDGYLYIYLPAEGVCLFSTLSVSCYDPSKLLSVTKCEPPMFVTECEPVDITDAYVHELGISLPSIGKIRSVHGYTGKVGTFGSPTYVNAYDIVNLTDERILPTSNYNYVIQDGSLSIAETLGYVGVKTELIATKQLISKYSMPNSPVGDVTCTLQTAAVSEDQSVSIFKGPVVEDETVVKTTFGFKFIDKTTMDEYDYWWEDFSINKDIVYEDLFGDVHAWPEALNTVRGNYNIAVLLDTDKVIAVSNRAIIAYEVGQTPQWYNFAIPMEDAGSLDFYGGLARIDDDRFVVYMNGSVHLFSYSEGVLSHLHTPGFIRVPHVLANFRPGWPCKNSTHSRLHYYTNGTFAFAILVVDFVILRFTINLTTNTISLPSSISIEGYGNDNPERIERCSCLRGNTIRVSIGDTTTANKTILVYFIDQQTGVITYLRSITVGNVPLRIGTSTDSIMISYLNPDIDKYNLGSYTDAGVKTSTLENIGNVWFGVGGYVGGYVVSDRYSTNFAMLVNQYFIWPGETLFNGLVSIYPYNLFNYPEIDGVYVYDNINPDEAIASYKLTLRTPFDPNSKQIQSLNIMQSWSRVEFYT